VRAVEQPQLRALLRERKPLLAQHLVLVKELEAEAGPGQAGDDFAEVVAPLVRAVLGLGVGVGGGAARWPEERLWIVEVATGGLPPSAALASALQPP
jgi:hypothetical protein